MKMKTLFGIALAAFLIAAPAANARSLTTATPTVRNVGNGGELWGVTSNGNNITIAVPTLLWGDFIAAALISPVTLCQSIISTYALYKILGISSVHCKYGTTYITLPKNRGGELVQKFKDWWRDHGIGYECVSDKPNPGDNPFIAENVFINNKTAVVATEAAPLGDKMIGGAVLGDKLR